VDEEGLNGEALEGVKGSCWIREGLEGLYRFE